MVKTNRVQCLSRPAFLGCEDIQIVPGMFYDLIDINLVDGRIFYTVVGKDGIEIQRPADYFKYPQKINPNKIQLMCGRCARKITPKRMEVNGHRK